MHPNDTTTTHQVTNRNFPSPAHLGLFAPIDTSVNPADFTDSDHAEFQRMALHQAAFNALGRARCELLACRSDYARAIKQAQTAITAMDALALVNGGAA